MPLARRDLSPSEMPELTSPSPRYLVRRTFISARFFAKIPMSLVTKRLRVKPRGYNT
jgi:hypothetical protein